MLCPWQGPFEKEHFQIHLDFSAPGFVREGAMLPEVCQVCLVVTALRSVLLPERSNMMDSWDKHMLSWPTLAVFLITKLCSTVCDTLASGQVDLQNCVWSVFAFYPGMLEILLMGFQKRLGRLALMLFLPVPATCHIVWDQLKLCPRSEQATTDTYSSCSHCSYQNLCLSKITWDLCYNNLRKLSSNFCHHFCEEAETLFLAVYHLQKNTWAMFSILYIKEEVLWLVWAFCEIMHLCCSSISPADQNIFCVHGSNIHGENFTSFRGIWAFLKAGCSNNNEWCIKNNKSLCFIFFHCCYWIYRPLFDNCQLIVVQCKCWWWCLCLFGKAGFVLWSPYCILCWLQVPFPCMSSSSPL